jgi:exosome complex component RRP43
METFQKLFPHAHLSRFLEQNYRPDGRKLTDTRTYRVVKNTFGGADGSCTVSIGKTCIACGISYRVTSPSIDAPKKGRIDLKILTNLLDNNNDSLSEMGKIESIQELIIRLLDGIIDLQDLCIVEGQSVWVLKIDAYCLDDDGNILDACILAIIGALQDLKFPTELLIDPNTGEVKCIAPSNNNSSNIINTKQQLVLKRNPFPLTFGIFQTSILADPCYFEEQILNGIVTIIVDVHSGEILLVHKPGGPSISLSVMKSCIEQTKIKGKQVWIDNDKVR